MASQLPWVRNADAPLVQGGTQATIKASARVGASSQGFMWSIHSSAHLCGSWVALGPCLQLVKDISSLPLERGCAQQAGWLPLEQAIQGRGREGPKTEPVFDMLTPNMTSYHFCPILMIELLTLAHVHGEEIAQDTDAR